MNHQYNEKVVDHFINPRNVGEIEDADGIGDVGSSSCGDVMKLFIKVEDDIIIDVKYKTFGCAAAIASGSMATELIKGKTVQEALKITNDRVTEQLGGLPKAKRHCSVLAEQALQNALEDYYNRKGIPSPIKLKSESELIDD
jgi:nitrogen fixation protein NifU and related proteins